MACLLWCSSNGALVVQSGLAFQLGCIDVTHLLLLMVAELLSSARLGRIN